MEGKLKSILKRTHWSSLLKAIVFAAAWFVLPFWLFFLIALYLYFFPSSGSKAVVVPFFTLLLLCLLEPVDPFLALVFGGVFYYLLLIKDLLIIDRKSAYEVLVIFLSFMFFRIFYERSGGSLGGASIFSSFLISLVFSLLMGSFMANFSDTLKENKPFRRMTSWLSFILIWQLLIVGLFLPLDFIYQSVAVFLVAVVFIDLVPQYLFGDLSRTKVLALSSVVFATLAIVLGSARWSL